MIWIQKTSPFLTIFQLFCWHFAYSILCPHLLFIAWLQYCLSSSTPSSFRNYFILWPCIWWNFFIVLKIYNASSSIKEHIVMYVIFAVAQYTLLFKLNILWLSSNLFSSNLMLTDFYFMFEAVQLFYLVSAPEMCRLPLEKSITLLRWRFPRILTWTRLCLRPCGT